MTRHLLFWTAFLALTISCGQKSNKQTLQLDNFTYCAYTWTFIDDTKSEHEFYLAQYLNIDKNGNCKIMRHERFKDSAKYFTTIITDGLASELNDLFLEKTHKDNYTTHSTGNPLIYDDFIFTINYSSPQTGQHSIKFLSLPQLTPSQIINVKSRLDSIIFQPDSSIKPFDLTSFTDSIKKYSLKTDSLPKLPPIRETIKFTPPDVPDK